jgi:peroxiredoxin
MKKMMTLPALLVVLCLRGLQGADGGNFQVTTYSKPERLPAWSARDQAAADVRLDDVRGNPFVAIIFRGHGCYRCVQQLGKFAEVESQFRQRGVRLLGITNEPVDDMVKASEATPLPFPILSDSRTSLADALGAKDVENWHGIILVDAVGKLRWSATGTKPYSDYRAVLSKIDELKLQREALAGHQIERSR